MPTLNGAVVEEVPVVVPAHSDRVGLAVVDEGQVQIRLGDAEFGFDDLDVDTVEGEVSETDVLIGEADLEQRMVGGRTARLHQVDESVERDVGVLEGSEIGVTHRLQYLSEGVVGADFRAQHQGSGEHADQPGKITMPAPGDRCADRDVGRPG